MITEGGKIKYCGEDIKEYKNLKYTVTSIFSDALVNTYLCDLKITVTSVRGDALNKIHTDVTSQGG